MMAKWWHFNLEKQLHKIPWHENKQKPSVMNKDECNFRISAVQNESEYVAYDDWP